MQNSISIDGAVYDTSNLTSDQYKDIGAYFYGLASVLNAKANLKESQDDLQLTMRSVLDTLTAPTVP